MAEWPEPSRSPMSRVDSGLSGPVWLSEASEIVREKGPSLQSHSERGRTVAVGGQAHSLALEGPAGGGCGTHCPAGPFEAGHALPGAAGEVGQDILSLSSSGNPCSGQPPGEQPFLCVPGLPRLLGSGGRTLLPRSLGLPAPRPPSLPRPFVSPLCAGSQSS